MKGLLVFGQTGQMAHYLARLAPEARFLSRHDCDLAEAETVAACIHDAAPRVVINAAAYTAVDRAETEPELAALINCDAPAAMAAACAARDIPLVHISTDYVFDGSGTAPRRPSEPTEPLGVYGATKLAGEAAILQTPARAAILRTSWVFSAHGQNFLKSMLRLGAERDTLRIVADQIGGPTPAPNLAQAALDVAARLVAGHSGGLYHFAGAPDTSWAGFAREIFAQAGIDCRVEDIPTSDYPTPAQRPLNSRLDCSDLAREHGITRPDWRKGIAQALAELEQTT